MLRLIILGLLASALFSTSFVLYQLMSVQGGHWFWSASLRCIFMGLLLSLIILLKNGGKLNTLIELAKLFAKDWQFWCLTGGIGFGTYGLLAFAADHGAGWVIASTYLFTVVASLFVLAFFGQGFNRKVVACSMMVFIGVIFANLGEGRGVHGSIFNLLIMGALPAFIAGFCFPIGNQLVWQASKPKIELQHNQAPTVRARLLKALPHINSPLLANPFHKVWLMSVGSLPLWLMLGLVIQPRKPSMAQITTSFLVALLAGVLGTSVFLYARGRAHQSHEVASVDATQASEIIFALLGGMLLLNTPLPHLLSWVGIGLIIGGLLLFSRLSQ